MVRSSENMLDTLLSLAVLVGILGLSAVFTEWFARRMYYRCRKCATLNAKRRSQCRHCGEVLP
jgi:hypothetical protein